MGLITDLIGRRVACIGLGNAYTQPLGYVIFKVQVYGVQDYNEDQIALVVPYLLNFAERIPIILGTPTISCFINVMKEREIDALEVPWANARVAHLLSVWRDGATMVDDQTMGESSPDEHDKVVITKNRETVDAFYSHVIPMKAEKAYLGSTFTLWPKHCEPKTALYCRVSPFKTCTPSWGKVARTQLCWWGIVWPTPKPSKRKPWWPGQWLQLWCQSCQQRPGCQREGWAPKPSHT